MMQKPVADTRFVDVARLRIGDLERLIAAMAVGMIDKVGMERKEVVHQTKLKFLDILLLPLSRSKFFPCLQEILHSGYFFKISGKSYLHEYRFTRNPPPTQ